MVTTNDRRRMLEDAWDDAPDGDATLRSTLRSNERAASLVVAGGSLSSITKNASSHSYAFGNGNITAVEVANVWRELIDLFDALFDAYTAAGSSTSDETIYAEMKRRLVPINSFTNDYAGMCYV